MQAAHEMVRGWMETAGMQCRLDPAGNFIGRWGRAGDEQIKSPTRSRVLLIGSHLDTVINAGKFDGALGVIMGLGLAEMMAETQPDLPFAIDVVGFCEEEGVRFQTPYIGSRAIAGGFPQELLERRDAEGVTVAEALKSFGGSPDRLSEAVYPPENVVAYIEPHIEQGPVLELQNLSVGIVTGIVGQSRATFQFTGRAGHAGTVPMDSRQDALVAAARFIVEVQEFAQARKGLMATVGHLEVVPNVANVIPAQVNVRIDMRHADDATRQSAFREITGRAEAIAERSGLKCDLLWVQEQRAVTFDSHCLSKLEQAFVDAGQKPFRMSSGAGHDAVVTSERFRTAMLFVRCEGGVSHHPDEIVSEDDVAVALDVLWRFVLGLADEGPQS